MPFAALLSSKLAREALGTLAIGALIVLVYFHWQHRIEHRAVEKLLAKEQVATQQEHERRVKAVQDADAWAQQYYAAKAQLEKANGKVVYRLRAVPRYPGDDRCIAPDSLQSIRSIR